MNMSIQSAPSQAQQPIIQGAGGGAPAAATVTASGNVGLGAPKSSFDRAWDDSWVPPAPEKPRPPMFALQLAGNTELVKQVNTLLYTKDVSAGDLQALMDLLATKVMELSINGEMMSMKDRQQKIEANQKERDKEFEIARAKAISAHKKAELEKFFGMVKSIASVALSAAVIAAGVLTGNPVMAIYGGYMLVNATMDVIDSVRTYQGKDPIGFRLSVGELAGLIAEKVFGADKQTALWINLGAEITFGLVMMGGAAAYATAAKAAKAAEAAKNAVDLVETTNKFSKTAYMAQKIGQGAQIVNGVTNTMAGINKIQLEYEKYDLAETKSRLDRLQLIYDQLQKQLEASQDLVKSLSEAIGAIWENAGDRLKTSREAQDRVWGGGRRNMV